ncbi:MAG: GNAT family N-acetyltransferase [Ichthyobacteriaceae bacterium]|nr:GNAT family N-acetyltransferase [Ichthyobacteriaceae bacterium]
MDLNLVQVNLHESNIVFDLLKSAAERVALKKINHWQYWKNPPIEKINWVKDGIANNEFYFIKTTNNEVVGMVRILDNDLLYWGKNNVKAKYIHSLVIVDKYRGNKLGSKVIDMIENDARKNNCDYLRLDCDSKNPNLIKYYTNQGFIQVGEKTLPISTYNLFQKNLRK